MRGSSPLDAGEPFCKNQSASFSSRLSKAFDPFNIITRESERERDDGAASETEGKTGGRKMKEAGKGGENVDMAQY